MHTSNLTSISNKYKPHNLGFYISPDITIEYVGAKKLSNHPVPVSLSKKNDYYGHDDDENDDDDDVDSDQYFNPLKFCKIILSEDEEKDSAATTTTKADPFKTDKKAKMTHGNENSSFVCNGTDAKNTVAVVTKATATSKPKKRHACHICPKTFGWSTDLKRHLLIHTGERPFKCTICCATFTRNFLLQKHKTKFHQCLSPNEISQLNNNVAKNLMEIKEKMRQIENAKDVKDVTESVKCSTE